MNKQNRSAIIIAASSDIGTAMCHRWLASGWDIYGTYRHANIQESAENQL